MNEHPHRARARFTRGTLSVALVLALAGVLFAANAKFARADGQRHPEDLDDLARVEIARVERLSSTVDDLRGEVDDLAEAENDAAGASVGSPAAGYVVEGGATPVSGPGLTVTLDDAPQDALRPGVDLDRYVVHQQDLQGVINALWAGGAEAMQLMDQRVISTSAFRCVGNVLRLQGRVYSPPYVVHAIGDPAALRAALDASQAVSSYVSDAALIGLGWKVEDAQDDLRLPAYSGPTELDEAEVPAGTEVLPGLPDASATATPGSPDGSGSEDAGTTRGAGGSGG
ncbi:DUF881 domain-containing protein [Cellulomonas massiliensis]|uniref:DUF881 domain-containing protein n=1 Tax=Cellulomonas massiliensis TaxID=1465811 RepID=UPI0002FA6345|nr:DUF881 domain-containing protein [Cellulomonas massiliensis]